MLEYPSLRFIDASHVASGLTDLTGFDVLTATGRKIGAFDGLIVDPPERAIKFAVVDRGGRARSQRLLVPLTLAQIDLHRKALQVDVDSDAECAAVDVGDFPEYSDDDFQAAFLGGPSLRM